MRQHFDTNLRISPVSRNIIKDETVSDLNRNMQMKVENKYDLSSTGANLEATCCIYYKHSITKYNSNLGAACFI